MKECTSCHKIKPLTEFYSQADRKTGYSMCKECYNEYCIKRWIQFKIDAIIYKGSACVDCGISYPNEPYCIFDFHHTDPTSKEFNWTKARLLSKVKRYKELDKCELLCANCHRKRHHT